MLTPTLLERIERNARPHWLRVAPITTTPDQVAVYVACPACGGSRRIAPIPLDGLAAWAARDALVQVALPKLSPEEREGLQTGYCGPCWERDFGPWS